MVTQLPGDDICARVPELIASELINELIPPREFATSSFDNYRPDVNFPSQSEARDQAASFVGAGPKKLFGKKAPTAPGLYLDGGFGVGKTHLLAAMFHAYSGSKLFGSFMAFTSLVGALGFAKALDTLSQYRFIAIDEFELDDPGDTMMMSRLLNELAPKGVKFAATSNTPPNALGEGRFAAADFQREIHGIADQFEMLRIDGEDHRHRPVDVVAVETSQQEFFSWLAEVDAKHTAVDAFDDLLRHLSTIHPSRYGRLLESIDNLGLEDCHVLENQVDALRFVAFVDRAYEAQLQIRATGQPLTKIFSPEYLSGGYRKKYLRAVSRLGAMTQ